MILPTKHISESKSLLGAGGILLNELQRPQTVTGLWEKVRYSDAIGTYERFVLTLDMLFLVGAIEFKDGLINRGPNAASFICE